MAVLPSPATPTPLDQADVATAFAAAYEKLTGTPAATRTPVIRLLVAHSALETGWWKHIYNYNLGNRKASAEEPHCLYACGENLPTEYANGLLKADPEHVTKVRDYVAPSGQSITVLNFKPPHAMCRFASYPDLAAGAAAHIGFLKARFPRSWIALHTGDPGLYATTLRQEGYYTAEPAAYAKTLTDVLKMVAHPPTQPVTLPTTPKPEPFAPFPTIKPGETGGEYFARCVIWLAEPPQPNMARLTWLAKQAGETNPGPEAGRLTNCATTPRWLLALCGAHDRLVGISYQAAFAIDPGGPVSWLRAIAMRAGALYKVDSKFDWSRIKKGWIARFNTPGHNDDHMEVFLSEPNAGKEALHGGGGRAGNAVTVGTSNMAWSSGRPIAEVIDTDKLLAHMVLPLPSPVVQPSEPPPSVPPQASDPTPPDPQPAPQPPAAAPPEKQPAPAPQPPDKTATAGRRNAAWIALFLLAWGAAGALYSWLADRC